MRTCALSEDILLTVEKPARYIGGEIGSIDPAAGADVRFCMCFPDVYEVGMSHLGIQILYDHLNHMPGVSCERVYSPWTDLDRIMRERMIPLFALESQRPVKDFDFLGITLQYEMCYTNILQILDLSGIPLAAADRSRDDPVVIGGGPCTYNPEPIAEFFDLFYIGEGETRYADLIALYRTCRAQGASREEFIHEAGKLPGIYAPGLYEPVYHDDGTFREIRPLYDDVPRTIRKEIVRDLSGVQYIEHPIIPFIQTIQDRVTLEVMRGCIRGCRFCQAGQVYKPVRERDIGYLKHAADTLLKNTGYDEITLSSLSSSDYSGLAEIVNYLIDHYKEKGVNISLPSLRIDAFSLDVMSQVQDIKKSSLTFAPEAGTQRMRNVINKGLTEDDIFRGSAAAFEGGWNKVKLYFMLGLPGETEEDMRGIAELADAVAHLYFETVPKEKRQGKPQITASSSFFIPKPFTALQWARMYPKEEYLRRAHLVKDAVRAAHHAKCIRYMYHEADVAIIEGVLARGDRKLSAVIRKVYEAGGIYDAWREHYCDERWMNAFSDCGIDPGFYIYRERPLDEAFPWDHLDAGVRKEYLIREWKQAMQAAVTPNCREACAGCGAASFGCGVCPGAAC